MSGFYTGKKVVVTGGAGFLGSHLVAMLREAGASVFVSRSHVFDLRINGIAQAVINWGTELPDLVFHLAARVSGIASTSAAPADHIYDNAMMALNMITACAHADIKIVVAGSVCAYPEHASIPMREIDLWNGAPEPTNASYGNAKRLALATLQAYHQQYKLRCAYLLSSNLYGPGDNFDPKTSHVIPALIRKVDTAQKRGDAGIAVWGSGAPTRDFLYVKDAAKAYMAAGELVDEPTPINIGSGQEISIAQLVELVKAAMGFQGDTVFDRSRPDGQMRRLLDISRAAKLMDWSPETTIDDGLDETVEWWRGNNDRT